MGRMVSALAPGSRRVNMLSEGWDVQSVSHILGLRAPPAYGSEAPAYGYYLPELRGVLPERAELPRRPALERTAVDALDRPDLARSICELCGCLGLQQLETEP
jgi:hypothetical protein